jgi:hypothetical protein
MRTILLSFLIISTIGAFGQTKETEPAYLLRLHGPWKTHESKNFRLYYRENPKVSKNLSDSDLKAISQSQQDNLYCIGKLLSVPKEDLDTLRKINIWMFQDLKEKTEITKISATDFCIPPYWSIYCTYASSKAAHELGHMIIDEYWGYFKSRKYNFIIAEGFASFVDEGHGKRNYDYLEKAKKVTRHNKYSMSNIINDVTVTGIFKNPYTQKAIVAGGFVKYLIKEYGIEKFKNLWLTLTDNGEAFNLVYNKSLDELAIDYMAFLKNL